MSLLWWRLLRAYCTGSIYADICRLCNCGVRLLPVAAPLPLPFMALLSAALSMACMFRLMTGSLLTPVALSLMLGLLLELTWSEELIAASWWWDV